MRPLLGPLFPDEPVWSGVSRAIERFPSLTLATLSNLFPKVARKGIHFAFPLPVKRWAEVFGYGNEWEEFLDHHTYWPWVRPFREYQVISVTELRKESPSPSSRFSRYHPFVEFAELSLGGQLKACRVCFARDTARFGVPYWHLVHQFEGLSECPHDGAPLVATRVTMPGPYNWRYSALKAEHLDGAAHVLQLDGLQHYLAKHIISFPKLDLPPAIGRKIRLALWDQGIPMGCKMNAESFFEVLRARLGVSAAATADGLLEWEWVLFGRARSFPMHFLIAACALGMNPRQLANSKPPDGRRHADHHCCISRDVRVQRTRSRRYERIARAPLWESHSYCIDCWRNLKSAHPKDLRDLRFPAVPSIENW